MAKLLSTTLVVFLLNSLTNLLNATSYSSEESPLTRDLRVMYNHIKHKLVKLDNLKSDENKKKYNYEKKYNEEIYLKREKNIKVLRDRFKSEEHRSSLFCFPELDVNTFNHCIRYLDSLNKNPDKDKVAILYMWSYLTGIKVFGLKGISDYYFENNHLISLAFNEQTPSEEVPTHSKPVIKNLILKFTFEHINIELGEDHKMQIPVPHDLILSSVFYRTHFNKKSLPESAKEYPLFVYDFFKNELSPLNPKLTGALLECVLRLKIDETPYYSLGLMKLFKNTAIYLSSDKSGEKISEKK